MVQKQSPSEPFNGERGKIGIRRPEEKKEDSHTISEGNGRGSSTAITA